MAIFIAQQTLLSAGLICPALFVFWLIAKHFPSRLIRSNFRSQAVPVIGGLALLATTMPLMYILLSQPWPSFALNQLDQRIAATIAIFGFGLLGLIDDLFGDRTVGGFRGHFSALFRQRRLTTGFIKAAGGGLLAFACAYYLASWMLPDSPSYPRHPAHDGELAFVLSVPLYAAFIALSANTINLLDLRPGRALIPVMISSLGVAFVAVTLPLNHINLLASALLGFALLLYLFDRFGKIMLGDSGSNAFGAVLAVCWICVLTRWEIAICVALLAAFQIWCEKHSLSRFIESKPLLRALDRKIGVR